MKRIFLTVTNDLTFDQRMHRICTSLSQAGYSVTLVGRRLKSSIPLKKKTYRQKRIRCLFHKGFLFYAEYNVRLFFYLNRKNMDAICAIDLDTILPCYFISRIKKITRVYDAHEYFTEMKEVRTRPMVKKFWLAVEKFCLPRFPKGYTVSEGLATSFAEHYGSHYQVVRNLPVLREWTQPEKKEPYLLYQGAVNEGRGFEFLIPAMRRINCQLVICGDGNFMPKLEKLIKKYRVEEKVELMGMLVPDQLWPIAQNATLGMGLAEKEGTNQFLALPNKFFDYLHAGLPQLAMAYPEYEKINSEYAVAILIPELSSDLIAKTINALLSDPYLLETLHNNCMKAREVYCWQHEEKKLLQFYSQIFSA